jgi:hypothetical protein
MEATWVYSAPTEPDHLLVGGIVKIPLQEIRIKGLESSQEDNDPMNTLVFHPIVIEHGGIEYDLGKFTELESDVQETLLEWYSPT